MMGYFMKKKLYDFTLVTAVVVILAYVLVLILATYTILDSEELPLGGLFFTGFIILSLIALIIHYGFWPIILTNHKISHRKKSIDKVNAFWYIRRNYRYRYDELVFRDKMINYKKLSRKELRSHEIVVQHSIKYEMYIDKYLGPSDESNGD